MDRHAQGREGQHPEGQTDEGRQGGCGPAHSPLHPWVGLTLEAEFRKASLLSGAEAHLIPMAQHQLLHPAASPPEAIGGAAIGQQPVVAMAFQQGVAPAHGWVLHRQIGVGIATDPIARAMERDPAGGMPRHMELHLGRCGGPWAAACPALDPGPSLSHGGRHRSVSAG